jgi:glucan phosphoethanolaminetransferase (alkaline phosphatase superfamily)
MTFRFNGTYFGLSVLLLAILVIIGVFVADQVIRPFVGDVLVVIWIYTVVQSFLAISTKKAAWSVLIFACTVETLQYFEITKRLALEDGSITAIIIGTTFDWLDFVAYGLGCFITLAVERICRLKHLRENS